MANNLEWSDQHSASAIAEGWDIWDCSEACSPRRWQVQRIDEAGILNSDSEAWQLVANGTEAHHAAARAFIAVKSPAEWADIEALMTNKVE